LCSVQRVKDDEAEHKMKV